MKVFCREHEKGFFAPRQNPIKCENRGHVLGELNFAGDERPQVELHWQYCCNCEHFCPISENGESLERCPVCTRRASQMHVCDRCFTVSFESSTPLESKNFTLTTDGVPRPACPGCLQTSSAEVREHACEELGRSFTTALTTCPICRERLDIGPSFPNLVSQFLRKTKATNKCNVTFDYDTGLFVEIEDGEFVVVPDASDGNQVMVVPRLTQFSDPREFLEIYQDYYHYRGELRTGEVFIHESALAERTDTGWTFKSPGVLEVVDDHPKRRPRKVRFSEMRAPEVPPAPVTTPAPAITPVPAVVPAAESPQEIHPSDIDTQAPAAAPAVVAAAESSRGVCQNCGSAIEDKYAFCWNCGQPMQSPKRAETKRPKNPSRRLIIDMNDVPDLPPLDESHRAASFPVELPREQKRVKRGNGSGLKLMLMLMVAGVALISGMVGMWWLRPSSQITTAASAAQTGASTSDSAQASVPTVADSNTPAETPVPTRLAAASADDELRDFRQRGAKGSADDRRNVMRDISRLEKEYPNDYRFPYERARLTARASEAKSRDAAFQALFLAAQRAIKSGKAAEMLQGLETDKSRDFRKLSHGRVEWAQIVQSLKNRDATLLATNTHSTQAME
jgi:hypothetical protein